MTAPAVRAARPVGEVTRGTTGVNRLRRVDRWLVGVHGAVVTRAADPLVVDLGYGASPVTTVEMFHRLRVLRPDVEVVGLEIEPRRVAEAHRHARPGLSFHLGGFELPLPTGRRPTVIRAFNVLRQYEESRVDPVWRSLSDRLATDGVLVEGTCDEIGRLASWVTLGPEGPRTFTMAARLASLTRPGELAARLPKVLIHRNVPGEAVHAWLADFDREWANAAPYAVYGARQRWVSAVSALATRWPIIGRPNRWRLGEVTVAWHAVAPHRAPGWSSEYHDR